MRAHRVSQYRFRRLRRRWNGGCESHGEPVHAGHTKQYNPTYPCSVWGLAFPLNRKASPQCARWSDINWKWTPRCHGENISSAEKHVCYKALLRAPPFRTLLQRRHLTHLNIMYPPLATAPPPPPSRTCTRTQPTAHTFGDSAPVCDGTVSQIVDMPAAAFPAGIPRREQASPSARLRLVSGCR